MIRDDAIARVRRGLGYDNRLNVSLIIDALKDAQNEVEQRSMLPWFLQSEISSIFTIVGEERIPTPVDFILEIEAGALWVYDDSLSQPWIELKKDDPIDLRTRFTEPGQPEFYAISDGYFRLFPTPDAEYTLKMIYYKQDVPLDSNIENKWLKYVPYLIIGLAGALLASQRFNDRAKATFEGWAQLADTKLDSLIEAREHAQRRYVMGGED